jgi:hypothetical protein
MQPQGNFQYSGSDQRKTGTVPNPLVPLDEIVSGGPPKDGIPPIDDPKFVSIDGARSFVSAETQGILVKVGDDVRFYPYNIMLWHEIVNDEIGGKPLSITFCPLCATGIVFEREIDGTIYDFGTSGKLYQSNLVMYDRQTDSYWSQALGKAIVGEMTGTELVVYPSAIVDFGTAAEKNPEMKVLSTDTGHVRDYSFDPYSGYEDSDFVGFGADFVDRRLPAKTLVYGIFVDGQPKAYEFLKLIELSEMRDEVNGHNLLITVSEDKEINVFDETADRRIVGIVSFWFSWSVHNPDSEIWTGE